GDVTKQATQTAANKTAAKTAKSVTAVQQTASTDAKAKAPRAAKSSPPKAQPQRVAFVGSGPGDPDLLTVRAAELLRSADVVITEVPGHEDLVRVVVGAGEVPEFVDGGFGEDGQPLTHAARAKVVVKQVKTGRRVVRLISGDPFVYASGPEEAQACAKAGLAFEIVPGVSAVTAVPAYAGIPLTTKTQREVAVVTCGEAKVD